MSIEDIQFEVEEKLEKGLSALENEFKRIRTGRASVSILDHIHVIAYGESMPLQQLASITVPEPQQLMIKPYDKGTIRDIEKALVAAELGMAPQNDGEVIRINIPPLSSERRQQLASDAKECAEKAKISLRNARRDGIKETEALGKSDKLPEDLVKKAAEDITELLKQYEAKVETALKTKTADITNI